MNSGFINRLVGTSIVVIAAIVFIPNILDGEKVHYKEGFKAIPERSEFKTIDLQESIDEKVAQAEPLKQEQIEDIAADDDVLTSKQSQYAAEQCSNLFFCKMVLKMSMHRCTYPVLSAASSHTPSSRS